jgi:dolichol kinase
MAMKKIKQIFIIGFILVVASFFLDDLASLGFELAHIDALTSVMHFLTDFGVIFLVALIAVATIGQKKYQFLLFMLLSAALALEIAFILKIIFQVPRPYLLLYEEPLFLASGYSFPSMHAAFTFAIIPFQKYIFKKRSLYFLYALIFLIVISRVYLGVHNISDIVAGCVVGLISTYGLLAFESKYKFVAWFKGQVKDALELRRQAAHLLIGISIVFLLKLQLLNTHLLFMITIIGGVFVLIARKVRIPVIHTLLEYFERPHHMARFPGRGSFFLILGAALTMLIFDRDIALAAIMIMAVGDSVTNIVGRYFGKIHNPLNAKKKLEGTGVAIIFATLAAFYFVPLWPAFVASAISMTIESIDLGWKRFEVEIDDNVVIPLVAGVVMTIMM